jgi:hypothetical protein
MHFQLFEAPLRCRLGLHRMIRARLRWAAGSSSTHYCGLCGSFFLVC